MMPYRDEPHPNPAWPFVTVALIAINVLVFLFFELPIIGNPALFEETLREVVLVPYEVTHNFSGEVLIDLLRSMFMHGSFAHLFGNMLYLWIFGDNVEDGMGHILYLVVYLLSGVVASAAHVIFAPNSQVPTLGASGAIAGALGAYLIMFPQNRIVTFVPAGTRMMMREMTALSVLGFWFVLQFLNAILSIGPIDQGGVAFMAHVGGFIAGAGFGYLWRSRN